MITKDAFQGSVSRIRLQARLADWVIYLSVTALLLELTGFFGLILLLVSLVFVVDLLVALAGISGPSAYFMGVSTRFETRVGRVLSTIISGTYLGTLVIMLDVLSSLLLIGPLVVAIGIGWPIVLTQKMNCLPWEALVGIYSSSNYDGRSTHWYLMVVAVLSIICVLVLLLR